MALSDHVQVTISVNSIGIARLGFGIPLILSASATWSERVRFYTDTAGVAGDFATDSPEYLAAVALFSQENQPEQIAIGRSALKPTQQYTVGAQQAVDATNYNLVVQAHNVANQTVTIASGSGSSIASIHNLMVAALNAVTSAPWTAAFAPLAFTAENFTVLSQAGGTLTDAAHGFNTGDGPVELTTTGSLPTGLAALTDYWVIKVDANTIKLASSLANALAGTFIVLSSNGTGTNTINPDTTLSPTAPFTVTANSAGTWFSVEIRDQNGLASATAPLWFSSAQTHADPGVAIDLGNIVLENSSWYALLTQFNSSAYVLAAAAWVETNKKLYAAGLCDTQTITGVVTAGGTADSMHTSRYSRSSAWYHPSPAQMMVAALYGAVLPLDPGSETWKFKQLVGPAPVQLTSTHRANLLNKSANTYQGQTPDVAFTWEGTSADGEFIDTIRGLDWWVNDLTDSLLEALLANPKVPYTDAGIQILANEMTGSTARAVDKGILAAGTTDISVPLVKNVAPSDKKSRTLRNMKASGTLAGAIHDIAASITATA